MKRNKHYMYIYYSYLIAFVSIFIMLAGLFFLCLNSYVETKFLNEKNNFAAYHASMEDKLRSFKKTFEFLYNDSNIKKHFTNEDKTIGYNHILISRNINRISKILNESNNVLILTDFEHDTSFTQAGTISNDDICITLGILPEELEKIKNNIQHDEIQFICRADEKKLTLGTMHDYGDGNKIYCLANYDYQWFIPMTQAKLALIDRDDVKRNDDHDVRYAIKKINLNESSESIKSIKACIYKYNSQYAEKLTYVYVCDIGVQWLYILAFFVALYLVLIVKGRKFIHYFSKKIYMPVSLIAEALGRDTSDDDINCLSESVKQLIYDNQLLNQKLSANKETLQKAILKDALYNSRFCFDDKTDATLLPFSNRKCRVVYFEYNLEKVMMESIAVQDEYKILYAVDHILEQALLNEFEGVFIDLSNNTAVFILSADNISDEQIPAKLLRIAEMVETEYHTSLFTIVGNVVESIKQIYNSYESTQEVLERRFSVEDKVVVFSEEAGRKTTELYYPVDTESLLIEYVLYGRKDDAIYLLADLIDKNLKIQCLDKQHLIEFKFAITATIKRIVRKTGLTEFDIFGKDIYSEINTADTKKKLQDTIFSLFETLCDHILQKKKTQKSRLTKEIIDYIEKNYDKDISLSDISDALCVSQGHISKTIRKNLDMSFKEYLDELRISVSKELLETTTMTVDEISKKVGYINSRSFIRVFKKYTNLAPGEYRKHLFFEQSKNGNG